MNPFDQIARPLVVRPGDALGGAERREKATRASAPSSEGRFPQVPNPWDLTPTECEVLRLYVAGERPMGVAATISRAIKTVNAHTDRLKFKMDAKTIAHAAVMFDRFVSGRTA